ncbi:MAG: GNAT family N-acetyltransferase [Planctomycetota bacterium]|jgi:ribosomal protein S18 acetylase RimI-like enzyme
MSISQANPDQLRPPGGDNPGSIVQVGAARRSEAIARLVSTGPAIDRRAVQHFLHYAETNAVSLDGLWARLGPGGRIEATVLAVPSPGRTAMIFATHPTVPEQAPGIARVVDHACGQVATWKVDLAQALVDPGEALDRRMLQTAGFQELAVLSYLERPLNRANPPTPPQWPADVRIRLEPYRDTLDGDLGTMLERSYEQTLDCPGLYGLRRTEDIIAGHKATGRFNPALWTMMWVDEEPAGVVLINPFPGHKTTELVYIGLAPFARGRGLGRQLLRHGLGLVHGRRERSVTLAVDERNTPALALYDAEGFRPAVQRVALIRSLRKAQ